MIDRCYYLVRPGTQRVLVGPYATRGEAENAWRVVNDSGLLAVAIYRDGKLIEVGA